VFSTRLLFKEQNHLKKMHCVGCRHAGIEESDETRLFFFWRRAVLKVLQDSFCALTIYSIGILWSADILVYQDV